MHELPWQDGCCDVVTSFLGIWGTTPEALAEVHRVLAPGGRVGQTVWGDLRSSSGSWALSPFRLATASQREHHSAMMALGQPGAGEELLARYGFVDIRRVDVPCVWEFADPEHLARAIAATGPAYEALQASGEQAFHQLATSLAAERLRDGLPLRAEIAVVGYVATRPGSGGAGWDG